MTTLKSRSHLNRNRFAGDFLNLEVRALQASLSVDASTIPYVGPVSLSETPVVIGAPPYQTPQGQVAAHAAVTASPQDQVQDEDDGGEEGDPRYEELGASDRSASVGRDLSLNDSVFGGNREGDDVNYVVVGNASHGTVELSANTGFYTYTPNRHYVGQDSFTFKVTDPGGDSADSNVATVSINVTPWAQTITAKASVTWECSPSGLSQWLGGTNSYGLAISATTYDGATFVGQPTLTFQDPGVRAFFDEKFLITPNMTHYRQPGPNGTTVDAYVATADIKWITSKASLIGLADLPDWIPDLFESSLESYCESKFTLTISADGGSNADITNSTSSPDYFKPTKTLK